MKSSHQTLMLGILLGMIAWVADAMINWRFIPGNTFPEVLFNFNSGPTFYVRVVVVSLFFFFGIITGSLMAQSERAEKSLSATVKLLDGIRKIHEVIVKGTNETELIAELLPLIEHTFSMEQLVYVSLGRDAESPQWMQSSEADELEPSLRCLVDEKISEVLEVEGIHSIDTHISPGSHLTSIGLGTKSFGVLYGKFPDDDNYQQSEYCKNFMVICDEIGYAISHLKDRKALQETAGKLVDLYDNAPVGIFTSTVGGTLLFVNGLQAKFMGADTPEQILKNSKPVTTYYADPDRRKIFLKALHEKGSVVDFESDFIGLDGVCRTLLFAARLKVDPEVMDTHIEGFAMDVSDARRAEAEHRNLQAKLAESQHFQSISVLAGGVAHEFNNILQGMMGSAYLAQIKVNDGESKLLKDLQAIQISGRRAAKLCDQLLCYAGKKAMRLSPQSPDACLENVLKVNTEIDTRYSDMIGVVQMKGETAKVNMDVVAFSEVVSQLISNAKEALMETGGEIKIYTEVRPFSSVDFKGFQMYRELEDGEYWRLKIIDNGEGIGKEVLAHIFEPFFTTRFLGRGLGLPSIAGLVEKFSGSLGVCSTPGLGTEFDLWLPLTEEKELLEIETDVDVFQSISLKGEGGKIWIVDDEPLICMTIERVFGKLDFEVGTAENGVDGLEKIRKDIELGIDIKCVILDVTMPKMGGLEMLHYLRALDADLPVLLMSGFDESDSLVERNDLKVDGFIHKPFSMDVLTTHVQQIIQST